MGVSTQDTTPVAAAVLSLEPVEVELEEASDGDSSVYVSGTMYHNGLNKNVWGLTESGATAIAEDLVGRDYTAAHPPLRGAKYDRSISAGQGAPIGKVLHTDVVRIDSATLTGGEFTAEYYAEVLDPTTKEKFEAGLATDDGYGVSIGIYADPASAVCSICSHAMASDDCSHDRGQAVEIEKSDGETETQIAGPLYEDGHADHLAHVWRPAYEGTSLDVSAASATVPDAATDDGIAEGSMAGMVPEASSVLAEPFDATDASEPDTEPADVHAGYPVRLSDGAAAEHAQRGSYVRLNHE